MSKENQLPISQTFDLNSAPKVQGVVGLITGSTEKSNLFVLNHIAEDYTKIETAQIINPQTKKVIYQSAGPVFGKYSCVQGVVNENETPEAAFQREVEEELVSNLPENKKRLFQAQNLNIKSIGQLSVPEIEIIQFKADQIRGYFEQVYLLHLLLNSPQTKALEKLITQTPNHSTDPEKPTSTFNTLTWETAIKSVQDAQEPLFRPSLTALIYYLQELLAFQL